MLESLGPITIFGSHSKVPVSLVNLLRSFSVTSHSKSREAGGLVGDVGTHPYTSIIKDIDKRKMGTIDFFITLSPMWILRAILFSSLGARLISYFSNYVLIGAKNLRLIVSVALNMRKAQG